jgi:hypothetical protein
LSAGACERRKPKTLQERCSQRMLHVIEGALDGRHPEPGQDSNTGRYLEQLASLLKTWAPAFKQRRTFLRVSGVLLALVASLERCRTVTKAVSYRDNEERWSAEYKVFSRSEWEVNPPNEEFRIRPTAQEATVQASRRASAMNGRVTAAKRAQAALEKAAGEARAEATTAAERAANTPDPKAQARAVQLAKEAAQAEQRVAQAAAKVSRAQEAAAAALRAAARATAAAAEQPASQEAAAAPAVPVLPPSLFGAVLQEGLKLFEQYAAPNLPIPFALDDTGILHAGHSAHASWQRDPLGPPFQVNLQRTLRFFHGTLLLPLHSREYAARALTVAFELVTPLKKPGAKATPDDIEAYNVKRKQEGLTHHARAWLRGLRAALDQLGYDQRKLLAVGDASYTNATMLAKLEPNIDYLGRIKKDAALYRRPEQPEQQRERVPTPEEVRKDESTPYQNVEIHFGGARRQVRYKEVRGLSWRATGDREVRLLIVAPTPYLGPGRRRHYREPAFLLTTDLSSPVAFLLQAYFDRWQIEVIHREAKSVLGVGEAQVWAESSITRFHSAHMALSSMLILASLRAFGPGRTDAYPPLPPWRRTAPNQRPSFHDFAAMLDADLKACEAAQLDEPTQLPVAA